MEKGWGLTLENSEQVGFFGNKPFFGFSLGPRFDHSKSTMFAGVDFPVNLDRREDEASPSSADEKRVVVGEVDFFSDNKNRVDHDIVKKESSHGEDMIRTDLDVNTGLQLVTTNTGSDQSLVDDGISSDMEDKRTKNELAKLQMELQQMHGENQRLKGMLTQVTNNCSALQMHIEMLMQQKQNRIESTQEQQVVERKFQEKNHENGGAMVPRQFMDLGPSGGNEMDEPATHSTSGERTLTLSGSPRNNMELSRSKKIAREDSPESESWAPNKVPKLNPTKMVVDEATEATMKKARVSVRARSEAPMISDGCQWRKYGQKMAKGNPCPRAYYRCTMAVGCPVRKQVQRCAEDRTILITTYEGSHNHPLPPAAMAMASTTSAAVSMLLSGSMPSADGMMNPNFLARTILPCSSSVATISASAPFPTVTLDLTQNPNPLQFQRPNAQFQVPLASMGAPQMSQVFGQGLYNQSQFSGLQLSQDVEVARTQSQQGAANQVSYSDTLSAATAAITADPNFTAALAAAISSIIGGSSGNNGGNTANTTSTSNNKNTNSFSGN